jgi:hypothetical protein
MARRCLVPFAFSVVVSAGCEELPNVPPTASFVYSPVAPIYAGQTAVMFNASASRDADGTIAQYVWNFGDGTAEEMVASSIVTHVFTDTALRCLEATYTVLLTIVDDKGDRGSASQTVRVIELPAPASAECQLR